MRDITNHTPPAKPGPITVVLFWIFGFAVLISCLSVIMYTLFAVWMVITAAWLEILILIVAAYTVHLYIQNQKSKP